MTTPKRNQKDQPQAVQSPVIDIRDFQDVRGIINIAENEGNAIAYRGHAPPPSNSTGPKKLYGQILKAKCKGDAIGFDQIPEGEQQATSQPPLIALDTGRYGAVSRQTNSENRTRPTPEMLAEFRSLPPNMQEMMRFLWAAGPPVTDSLPVQNVPSSSGTKKAPRDSR